MSRLLLYAWKLELLFVSAVVAPWVAVVLVFVRFIIVAAGARGGRAACALHVAMDARMRTLFRSMRVARVSVRSGGGRACTNGTDADGRSDGDRERGRGGLARAFTAASLTRA